MSTTVGTRTRRASRWRSIARNGSTVSPSISTMSSNSVLTRLNCFLLVALMTPWLVLVALLMTPWLVLVAFVLALVGAR